MLVVSFRVSVNYLVQNVFICNDKIYFKNSILMKKYFVEEDKVIKNFLDEIFMDFLRYCFWINNYNFEIIISFFYLYDIIFYY